MKTLLSFVWSLVWGAVSPFKGTLIASAAMFVVVGIAGLTLGLRIASSELAAAKVRGYQAQIDTLTRRAAEHQIEAARQRVAAERLAEELDAAAADINALREKIDETPAVAATCDLPPARVRELNTAPAAARRARAPATRSPVDGRSTTPAVPRQREPEVPR